MAENRFCFRIIDAGLGIGSCRTAELPDMYKLFLGEGQQFNLFYFSKRDMLILNEDGEYFEELKELAVNYLMCESDEYRQQLREYSKGNTVHNILLILERVTKLRKFAAENKTIGNPLNAIWSC